MRYTILVLAVALVSGTSQARADFVTYNLTGTIESAKSASGSITLPFSSGDHITWKLLYDRSTPPENSTPYGAGYQNSYSMKYAVISNIVDQTSGYHFLLPSNGGGLLLYGDTLKYPGTLTASTGYAPADMYAPSYSANLFLLAKVPFPLLNLSDLQLNSIPFNPSKSEFDYNIQYDMPDSIGFYASVDSISKPTAGTPEPGSITLFVLGATPIAVFGVRRRLRFRLVSFLAFADAA